MLSDKEERIIRDELGLEAEALFDKLLKENAALWADWRVMHKELVALRYNTEWLANLKCKE